MNLYFIRVDGFPLTGKHYRIWACGGFSIKTFRFLFLVLQENMESCQKPFLGRPQYFPPPKKSIFFQEQEISREREFLASQIGNYKKMFLIVQTYLGGQSL
jgi:hypothetical protein